MMFTIMLLIDRRIYNEGSFEFSFYAPAVSPSRPLKTLSDSLIDLRKQRVQPQNNYPSQRCIKCIQSMHLSMLSKVETYALIVGA
jgi:hypothetical protein